MSVDAPSEARPEPVGTDDPGRAGRSRAALAGLVAAVVALGFSELLAGLVRRIPSLVLAVGARVVDGVPPVVKDLAIAVFGVRDKAALIAGTVLLACAAGAALGVAARRGLGHGVAGFGAFAAVGALAASRDPQASTLLAALSAAAAAAVGIGVLRLLLTRAGTVTAPPETRSDAEAMVPRGNRRVFLQVAAGAAAAGALATAGGRFLSRREALGAARSRVVLPPSAAPLGPAAPGTSIEVAGISPLFTPTEDFFRIDTALSIPRIDPATWRLGVTGMVDRPLSMSFDELLSIPQVEADVTLSCVSNEVGGNLVGNARWTGVRLADVLERAGVRVGATQLVGRSVDGWTSGFPTELAVDGRDALIAVGMNGGPLPLRHGFPARLVVPGLYGYVSATKWLAEIELTTWEAFDAYWVPRGWAKEGPIRTQSRIDVPARGRQLTAGRVPVAGVAWAGVRGIDAVEVSVDSGPWQPARLADELAVPTWRQWVWEWEAAPGRHTLSVRATDGNGTVQTADRSRPAPDGATGHHSVTVDVA